MIRRAKPAQIGAASMVVVMALVFVTLLASVHGSRGVLFEHQSALNQRRSLQAQQLADAGLDWALAQLNGRRLDGRCEVSDRPDDATLVERLHAAVHRPLPGCQVDTNGRWHCQCPRSGAVRWEAPEAPTFELEIDPLPSKAEVPPRLRLLAHGCSGLDERGRCGRGVADAGHAQAMRQVALWPALAVVPGAVITATGRVQAPQAELVAASALPQLLAVHAGGAVEIDAARLHTPVGSAAEGLVHAGDEALAARRFDDLVLVHTGLTAALWRELPSVERLTCSDGCSAALASALGQGARMLWVDGDLRLDATPLGSPAQPVLLIVNGTLHVKADLQAHAAVIARGLRGSAGGRWHGAVMIAGDVQLSGTPRLVHDPAVLQRLQQHTGTWAPLAGSWSDRP